MKKVILDMQSRLYANAIRRILVQELENYQVLISENSDDTVKQCRIIEPDVLLMEVTEYSPWKLEERLDIRNEIKSDNLSCKIILIIDDAAKQEITENVKKAKQNGIIDAFLFTSATENYLVAVLDSL